MFNTFFPIGNKSCLLCSQTTDIWECIWKNRKLGPLAFGRAVDHMQGIPRLSKHVTSIWENLVVQMSNTPCIWWTKEINLVMFVGQPDKYSWYYQKDYFLYPSCQSVKHFISLNKPTRVCFPKVNKFLLLLLSIVRILCR